MPISQGRGGSARGQDGGGGKEKEKASRNGSSSNSSVEKKINYVLHKYNKAEISKVEGSSVRREGRRAGRLEAGQSEDC